TRREGRRRGRRSCRSPGRSSRRRASGRFSATGSYRRRKGQGEMSSLVQVREVHKHFTRGSERIDVLKGVNLDIPQGDFLALMGPSGSGKTTLLNLIGGLDTPTEGTVDVGGDRIDKMAGSRLSAWRARHIGFVFQLYNPLPVLTAA